MSKTGAAQPQAITDRLIRTVCTRIAANKRVRRKLPIWGRLHVDRPLPFLCVYRRPIVSADTGTDRLVTTEASYLFATSLREQRVELRKLISEVVRTLAAQFGGFLILELWSGDAGDHADTMTSSALAPRFRIAAPNDDNLNVFLETFQAALSKIKIARQPAHVETIRSLRCAPPGLSPVLRRSAAQELNCLMVGLEVRPIYRDPKTEQPYPLVLRDMRRELTRALRRAFYDFARRHTTQRPKHYHTLGRRAVVKAVWEVDRQMAGVSDGFDFLLQVTPTNMTQAWHQFRKNHLERAPVFRYRPLPADPIVLKRRLYATPLERVEDPTLLQLFREKQDELDRKITMLLDINTKRFVHGSLQVFGGVDDATRALAQELLSRLPPRTRDAPKSAMVDAATFAQCAEAEIDYLRQQMPDCKAGVRIRNDIASTMVSRGSLLVRKGMRTPRARVSAVLQHEVGTHVLTYWNGRAQPFRQLYSGLAGYEAAQEGLAVMTEYLVGGLSRRRLRQLAARVVAVRLLIEGASFVDTFRELERTYHFDQLTAFTVTMRVFRGGGLTKDAIYLRGLMRLLEYFRQGGELAPLLVGKLAFEHVPVIIELQWRKVLRPAPLRPSYLDAPDSAERLNRVCSGLTVHQLAQSSQA